jgi:hypothetical protein
MSVNVLLFGQVDGLKEGLTEVGQSGGGPGFEMAQSYGGHEMAESSAEVRAGEIVAGETVGEVASDLLSGLGLGFLASVIGAKERMRSLPRHAAVVAVAVSEGTEQGAALERSRGHGVSSYSVFELSGISRWERDVVFYGKSIPRLFFEPTKRGQAEGGRPQTEVYLDMGMPLSTRWP